MLDPELKQRLTAIDVRLESIHRETRDKGHFLIIILLFLLLLALDTIGDKLDGIGKQESQLQGLQKK